MLFSEAYWRHSFRLSAGLIDDLPDRATQERYFAGLLRRRERDRTPWRVCDECTELFVADWPQARAHVVDGTIPRGPGRFRRRLRVADYISPAARAWTQERGWWPAGVLAPEEVDDHCDLCAKPVWRNETVTFLTPDTVAEWRRAGLLTRDPAQPPRRSGGEANWVSCLPCTARLVSQSHRREQH